MLFDAVIGNPPYNRGMDIDFVNLGFELSKQFTCMITPGKWQTSDSEQRVQSRLSYGKFREYLVPYISNVVFYPYCKDIFNIMQVDGITYFLMDKNIHNKCIVATHSKNFSELNSVEFRSILNRETLINIGNEVIAYLGNYRTFKFPYLTGNRKYNVWMNIQAPGGSLSTIESRRKALFTGQGEIRINEKQAEQTLCQRFKNDAELMVFESDNINECKSFLSWMGTKFTQFFLFINQSKMTGILTNDCFRFVPAPMILDNHGNKVDGTFDHIYTDEELYKTFNIPSKYIEIIEAVIKERNIEEC